MPRAGQTWAAVSTKLYDDPKMIRAGRDARDLWLAALLWSVDQETDGLIPREAIPLLAFRAGVPDADEASERLVAVGAWHLDPAGYLIHGFEDWQQSSADRKAQRDAAAERKRRQRAGDASAPPCGDANVTPRDVTGSVTRDSRVTHADVTRRDVDVDVDLSSSSSGPSHQELSTGPDEDDDEHRAAKRTADAAIALLGRKDSERSPNRRRNPMAHQRACIETRRAVQGDEAIELALAEPELDAAGLAERLEPAEAPPPPPPPAPPPLVLRACPDCGCPDIRPDEDECPDCALDRTLARRVP